mmetsp:Transcript_27767/g.40990  ORF Transcript_27767/g.40990 Transcript_27767/m.40990 type:complete len:198 (+) Transcript_27767:112-705(+)|eukprot:CAMPEP_0194243398 /NCGR_PEP_ID=MMETSP0158-20130606/9007_1 /TAXON_ID=33649 /ORGANISM="Thalassionema nitzschioides, Strain L26-B" /LENGTH=197 /DNA_ID=CAMNT_0038978655 /DNA_START=84 /DNA_END=674 /DNA_ORIENTATION=+
MPSNYYDIDAILAEDQVITCTSQFDFDHLGPYLNSDLMTNHVPEKTKLVLPMWAISKWLALSYVKITSLPRSYSPRFLNNLEADPSHVNLRKKSPYFFLAGRWLVSLIRKQQQRGTNMEAATELQNILLKLYTGSRFRQVLDWSMASGEALEHEDNHLTTLETKLFRAGSSSMAASMQYRYYSKQQYARPSKRQRLE